MLPVITLLLAATTPAVDPDTRCMAAFAAIGGDDAATADMKEASKVGVLYFVGKLKGRTPGFDIEAALRAGVAAMGDDMQGDLARCAAELQATGSEMSRAGANLQKTP